MYEVILKDGKTIKIFATSVEWCKSDRMVKFFNDRKIVARINVDNVVGWLNSDYKGI